MGDVVENQVSEPLPGGAAPVPDVVGGRREYLARYVRRRLLILVPLAFIVTVAAFGMTHAAPGGPIAALLEDHPTSPEVIAAIKARYKLDDSVPVQYWTWISGVSHGDLGRSIMTNDSVLSEITRRLDVTLPLNLAGIAIAVLLGIPLGVLAALYRGRALDRLLVTVSVLFMSTPAFALALFALYFLGFKAGWFPLYGPGSWVVGRVHHLALPALVLGLHGMGFEMRLTRAAMLEQFEQDYIAFARARGLGGVHVTVRYALRNALIPVVTAAGLLLTGLADGFGPHRDRLLAARPRHPACQLGDRRRLPDDPRAASLDRRLDHPVNIVVDILYAFIDPRVGFAKATS